MSFWIVVYESVHSKVIRAESHVKKKPEKVQHDPVKSFVGGASSARTPTVFPCPQLLHDSPQDAVHENHHQL